MDDTTQTQTSTGSQQADESKGTQGATPESFDQWLEALPDDQKTVAKPLFEARLTALHNTVQATRQERDTFKGQVREALAKAEKGSELETQLTDMVKKLDHESKRADFYEAAGANECLNPKAAFSLALASDLFTKNGKPDWNAIKAEAPQLFGKPTTRGNAGTGTGGQPADKMTMTEFIRQQAGKT